MTGIGGNLPFVHKWQQTSASPSAILYVDLGYLRLTAATTVACSGFPLDRASASRACAASSIG